MSHVEYKKNQRKTSVYVSLNFAEFSTISQLSIILQNFNRINAATRLLNIIDIGTIDFRWLHRIDY